MRDNLDYEANRHDDEDLVTAIVAVNSDSAFIVLAALALAVLLVAFTVVVQDQPPVTPVASAQGEQR